MQFLRGDFSGRRAPVRPPWSWPEDRFIEHCTRCNACLSACQADILVSGRGGFPQVDFSRGGCEFCAACAVACLPRALGRPVESEPWDIRAHIENTCLARQGVVCRTCGEQCEAGAIRFQLGARGVALPQLDITHCTGCGACIAPCPAQAVRVIRLAVTDTPYQEANTA